MFFGRGGRENEQVPWSVDEKDVRALLAFGFQCELLGLFRQFLPLSYGYGSIVKAQGTADSAHF